VGGNHKRWLEEAWREDYNAGLISRDELHTRWFGRDILDWLKGLFGVTDAAPEIIHSISEQLTIILLNEEFQCTYHGVDVEAHLNVQAQTSISVDTAFSLTIIWQLGAIPDLSHSYLYFKNKGEVKATFTLDALVSTNVRHRGH